MKGHQNMNMNFDPQLYRDDELERFTLRISHNQKEKLAKIAQAENVSLNSLIISCITFALDNYNKTNSKK